MPRKQKTEIAVVKPCWKNPEEYIDYSSALIRYGLLMLERAKGNANLLESGIDDLYGIDGSAINLTVNQVQYLNMRMDGMTTNQACKEIGMDLAYPVLWEESEGKDSLYNFCIEGIRMTQARQAEDIVWDKAMKGENKDLLLMFAVKSRLKEYCENASVGGTGIVQLNFSIGGKPYEVITDTKRVQGDCDE